MKLALILYRQQFSRRIRSLIVWTGVWTLIGFLLANVFKEVSKTADDYAKLFDSLPPAILNIVNISNDYFTEAEKYLSGQFLTIYLLAGSIFTLFMGIRSIGGKLEDKTMMNILSKPLSRTKIYLTQAAVNVTCIILISLSVGLITFGWFTVLTDDELDVPYFIATFVGSGILFICLSMFGQLLGVLASKSRAEATGGALAVFSFFINGLSSLGGIPDWLQKLSVYRYFNTVQLRDEFTLDIAKIWVLAVLAATLLAIGTRIFRRKDIYF